MFCIAQFRQARNGHNLGNLIEWFVFDLGLKGIFMLVLRFAARRASGWRTAQQSSARQAKRGSTSVAWYCQFSGEG